MADPIKLYTRATPNGMKVSIALEEMGIPYELHAVDIMRGEQYTDAYKVINPNSKIPAIIDPDGPDGEPIHMMESAAILLYLAEKHGQLISDNIRLKNETIQWLFFQIGSVGPMFGQLGHFYKFAGDACDHPYPTERYAKETTRLLGVIDARLEGRDYIVGNAYSIADIALFPWVGALSFYEAEELVGLASFKNVTRWLAACTSRPAVIRGIQVGSFS